MNAMTNNPDELNFFKMKPIEPILEALGFATADDRTKPGASWESSIGKIKTFKGRSGHFMWTSHDGSLTYRGRNSGTIVDIACVITGSLGAARKTLREILGTSSNSTSYLAASSPDSPPVQQKTTLNPPPKSTHISSPLDHDLAQIESLKSAEQINNEYKDGTALWRYGDPIPSYLRRRNIEQLNPVFAETFRVNAHRKYDNVSFPYFQTCSIRGSVLVGVEQKNTDFKSYTKGGQAGFWVAIKGKPKTIVIVENPIDAMSYDILRGRPSTGYMAIRSGAEDHCIAALMLCAEMSGLETVLIATDNDAAGMVYAAKIMTGLRKTDLLVRYEAPAALRVDWTEVLDAVAIRDDAPTQNMEYRPETEMSM